jgi:hypothetical protein
VSTGADGERDALAAMREQYQERRMARMRRRQWKWALAMGVFWALLAAAQWLVGGDPVLRWGWTGVAVLQLVAAVLTWRRVRRAAVPTPGTSRAPGR